jgi:hypothetical protein
MSNSILTIDMITRKALEILENNLVITRNVNRQYDDSFAVEGAKIGSTLRIRLPDRALVTDGAALQVQDDNEQFTTLTVASQKHIGVNFTSAELTMQLDDFAERVLKPRISQLASSIDADVANAYRTIGNTVGTPGTTPATSLVLLQAQQKLNENAAVMSPRYATVNPAANAGLVEGMKGLFNPTDTISKQFKNGMMGMGVLGFEEVNMSQSIKQHTTGSRSATASTLVKTPGVTSEGSATILLEQGSVSTTINAGDVFTISGCNAVNPQTRESTGSLFQFVALTTATASSGTWTVTVAPMYSASHALATMSALPATGGVVTFVLHPLNTHRTWFTTKMRSHLRPLTCCCPKALTWLPVPFITVSACVWFASTTSTTIVCLAVLTFCTVSAQFVHKWPAVSGANLNAPSGASFRNIF